MIGLTRSAARELGRFGVRCNAIRPLDGRAVTKDHDQIAPGGLMELTMGVGTKAIDPEAFAPRMISPFVVWLCTDAASGVNGRSFYVTGGRVSLLTEPKSAKTINHDSYWTLDELDAAAPDQLVDGLTNRYRLDDHPDMQKFD